MTNPQSIGDRVEQAREAAERSVTWLSANTGIAEKTLRRRLVAPETFTIRELEAIARALNTTLEALLAAPVPA
jgi:hypothetical protein